jgi:hypothetical protein
MYFRKPSYLEDPREFVANCNEIKTFPFDPGDVEALTGIGTGGAYPYRSPVWTGADFVLPNQTFSMKAERQKNRRQQPPFALDRGHQI